MSTEVSAVLRVISRYKWMMLLLCLSAAAHAVLLTYLIPEKYKATALVLIRPHENIGLAPQKSDSKEILNFPVGGYTQVETPSKTYIEIIKSRAVGEKVVRILGLEKREDTSKTNSSARLLERVKEDAKRILTATWSLLKYGRVREPSPFEKAVDKYVKNISLTPIKNSYVFEITHSSEYLKDAAAVANTAANMLVEHSTVLDKEETTLKRQFVARQLRDSERTLEDARRALREFKEQNKSILFKDETTEKIRVISALEVSLEKTETELAGLLKQLTPSNPKVLKLEAEKDRLLDGINFRKHALQDLPGKESELAKLELNVKTAEATYELLKKEYDEAKIREARKVNEVRVVSPATPPLNPTKPIKIYYAAVSSFLALLIGIALAFFLDSLDTTLKTIESVEKVLQLPVLATIPRVRS